MAAGATTTLSLLLLLFSAVVTSSILRSNEAATNDDETCVYTIYIRTGSIWKGGTDSKISLSLAGADGGPVELTDLEKWGGLMGADYNYFERGNLDIFSGRAPCLSTPLCWLNLTSDGSGPHHGWYCNYVEVTTTGPHLGCFQRLFTIEQWLATDVSPNQLNATRDYCHTEGVSVLRAAGAGAGSGRRVKMEMD